jgi:hypothetical protein
MNSGSAIIMGFGWVGGFFVLLFLIKAFRLRNKILPEEEGKKSLLTVFPMAINIKGMLYSGPFSRVSIYSDMIVIRGLSITTILRHCDVSEVPIIKGGWVVMHADINGRTQKIKISTECNKNLVDQIEKWMISHA